MSTRAQVRFATREEGVSFSEHPNAIHAQFYVHSDGYPEFLGVEIANSILDSKKIDSWEEYDVPAKSKCIFVGELQTLQTKYDN